eukprot:12483128-Heterocapsa_arctica.AAC.1
MGRKPGSRKDQRKSRKLLERISIYSSISCTTSSPEEEGEAAEATAALTGDSGQASPRETDAQ